jgi:hypothetical protein
MSAFYTAGTPFHDSTPAEFGLQSADAAQVPAGTVRAADRRYITVAAGADTIRQ